MAERNWNFTKIHIEEMIVLANAGRRKGVEVPLSGGAIAVYINLRGRIYASKTGEHRFFTWASQKGIAKDLGWDPKKPKNRVSECIGQLRDAGIIKVWNKEDTSPEASRIRRMLKCGWSTSVYELDLLRVVLEKEETDIVDELIQGTDSNRTNVRFQPDPDPALTGGRSDSNRSKEEEVNNNKKENSIIINEDNREIEESTEAKASSPLRSSTVYNQRTDRYDDSLKIQERILREPDWKWLFEDYHPEDVDWIIQSMDSGVYVVEQIRIAVARKLVGLDSW